MSSQHKIWDTAAFLSPTRASSRSTDSAPSSSASSSSPGQALIILNLPIIRFDIFQRVWSSTRLRYCADGGANRLYDAFTSDEHRESFLPNLIKGDLDSIRPDVRAWYESRGVEVEHDPDQYSTDLMKCISALESLESFSSLPQHDLILFGGLTGRLDQTTHTLSLLHRLRTKRDKIWVVNDDEVAWVLDVGEHRIPVNHSLIGKTCGILPLGVTTAVISTSGLEWDVEDWETSFDTQISTSNHLVPGKDVTVRTTAPVWWCCAIREWRQDAISER